MKSITIISVPVSNQQKAKEFYLKMGLKLVTETEMGKNQTWIQLAFPNGGADITLVNWFDKMPAGCLQGAVILTDDLEAEKERLTKAGIETGKTDSTPWGKFSSIADPDGNTWLLQQK